GGADAADRDRMGEIDRTERIETMYVQRGPRLEEREGDWSALPWSSEGEGQHSVAHQRAECQRHLAAGALGVCAFDGEHLVGIGLVTPDVRPGVAQLAFLRTDTDPVRLTDDVRHDIDERLVSRNHAHSVLADLDAGLATQRRLELHCRWQRRGLRLVPGSAGAPEALTSMKKRR